MVKHRVLVVAHKCEQLLELLECKFLFKAAHNMGICAAIYVLNEGVFAVLKNVKFIAW